LRYSRTFEIRELSVPVSNAEQLKKFYRVIENGRAQFRGSEARRNELRRL